MADVVKKVRVKQKLTNQRIDEIVGHRSLRKRAVAISEICQLITEYRSKRPGRDRRTLSPFNDASLYRWINNATNGVPEAEWRLVEEYLEVTPGALSEPLEVRASRGDASDSTLSQLANIRVTLEKAGGSNALYPPDSTQTVKISAVVAFGYPLVAFEDPATLMRYQAYVYSPSAHLLLWLDDSKVLDNTVYASGGSPEIVDGKRVQNKLADPERNVASMWTVDAIPEGGALRGNLRLGFLSEARGRFKGDDVVSVEVNSEWIMLTPLYSPQNFEDRERGVAPAQIPNQEEIRDKIRRKLLQDHCRDVLAPSGGMIEICARALTIELAEDEAS